MPSGHRSYARAPLPVHSYRAAGSQARREWLEFALEYYVRFGSCERNHIVELLAM